MARLLLALLLAAAQAAILALALFAPHVSATHHAMYYDRTIDCWVEEGRGALPGGDVIRPATLNPDAFCRLLPRGWGLEEPFGRASRGAWSARPETEMLLPTRPADRAVALTLRGYAPASGTQRLTIHVGNATARQETVPHQGLRTICLPLSTGQPSTRIAITIAEPSRPSLAGDANDPRATGLELVEIRRTSAGGCGL